MIPLTFLEYELSEQPDKILSRLKWAVEEVESSWLDSLNNLQTTPTTHKDWIGQIDKRNLKFSLEEPGHFFKRSFNVLLKGKLELKASTTNVKIRLGLDNFSFLWIFLLYLVGIMIISDAITNKEFDSYFTLFFFLTVYPLLGTFLIRRRMKRAERKLDQLFA